VKAENVGGEVNYWGGWGDVKKELILGGSRGEVHQKKPVRLGVVETKSPCEGGRGGGLCTVWGGQSQKKKIFHEQKKAWVNWGERETENMCGGGGG